MFTEIALVSGGIDSVLVTAHVPHAQPLFIDYGQREAFYEREAVNHLWPQALTMDVPTIVPRGTYFPARNLLLATIAVSCAEADTVWMGGMADDFCADKTPAAFEAMSEILTQQAGRVIKVRSPFWCTTKAEAIGIYLIAGNDKERLLKTFSCYSPVAGSACGDCPACFRKACALISNDLPYTRISNRMFDEYFTKLHKYPAARQWTIIHAAKEHGISVVACDIDGVLTENTDGHNYEARVPNRNAIERLNAMDDEDTKIVLWSSRRECDRAVTEAWLKGNAVTYHALLLDKPPVSVLYDDAYADLHKALY